MFNKLTKASVIAISSLILSGTVVYADNDLSVNNTESPSPNNSQTIERASVETKNGLPIISTHPELIAVVVLGTLVLFTNIGAKIRKKI